MSVIRATFPVGALGCNCTILACTGTKEALVVDPGDEAPRILGELGQLGVKAVQIVHTHAHFDHVLGTDEMRAVTGAEVALHRDDLWLWENVPLQARAFGLGEVAGPACTPRLLAGGEVLTFGWREARVLHTPGHTPGSLCLFVEPIDEAPILFSGDTLFAGSVGRTDLWGGDREQLLRSIRGPIFDLPEHTLVIPGHGANTTIGLEREDNPYVGRPGRG